MLSVRFERRRKKQIVKRNHFYLVYDDDDVLNLLIYLLTKLHATYRMLILVSNKECTHLRN